MCGIAGLVVCTDRFANPEVVQQMTDRMNHRGPDADGLWSEGVVVLGHRRLSIIDLSEAANQPFVDPKGRYVVVFNGEIYNFQSIKQQLSGYPFQTQSDTEVLLAAYERWGVDCLSRLNGMFAFAIWDRHTHQLLAARDRLGKKPFYYYHTGDVFLFASEVRALLATGLVARQLDTNALAHYLMYQTVPEPYTLLAGIRQLTAGHFGSLTNHVWHEKPYWSLFCPPPVDSALLQSRNTVQQQVRLLLQEAVERRMISDVPLGAFLSGGIDSAAVVALMAQQTEQPVNTFTITFDDAAFDESDRARAMAKRFNTRHTELPLSPAYLLAELPNILASMDQPSGDGPNTYMVSKLTKEAGITVALSGLGGDEVFAGYSTFSRYARLRQVRWLWRMPKSVRQPILQRALANVNPQKRQDLIGLSNLEPMLLFPLLRQSLSAGMTHSLLAGYEGGNAFSQVFAQQRDALAALAPMSQITISELTTYTKPLLLRDSDQMSMAHALELRVPLLDYQLIEFMMNVSDHLKMGTFPKQLLVESLQPLLPSALLQRPKQGFSFPWSQWMRGELRSFCTDQIDRLSRRGLFEAEPLRLYYDRFQANDPAVHWNQIWLLVTLEHWLNLHGF